MPPIAHVMPLQSTTVQCGVGTNLCTTLEPVSSISHNKASENTGFAKYLNPIPRLFGPYNLLIIVQMRGL